jgi:hypothetical protein
LRSQNIKNGTQGQVVRPEGWKNINNNFNMTYSCPILLCTIKKKHKEDTFIPNNKYPNVFSKDR